MSNKNFWHSGTPFLTNKGILIDKETSLIYTGKTIDDEKQVAETLHYACIDIVERTSGNKAVFLMIQILNFHQQ